MLSKIFQSQDVDAISTTSLFEQSRQQLLGIDRKDYFELSTIKIFLNKVKKGDDDLYYFQDVIIKDFENVKDSWSN